MPHGAAFSGLLTSYLFRIVFKIGEKLRLTPRALVEENRVLREQIGNQSPSDGERAMGLGAIIEHASPSGEDPG